MIMQNQISEYVGQLQELLNLLGNKIPDQNISVQGTNSYMHDPVLRRINFFDTRFPNMLVLGYVRWDSGKYIVQSRLIENKRYRDYNSSYRMFVTKDVKKAVKLVLQYIKPYDLQELVDKNSSEFRSFQHNWAYAFETKFRNAVSGITRDVLIKEIKALLAGGVKFHTLEFQHAAKEGVAMFDEHERRKYIKHEVTYVNFAKDELIYTRTGRQDIHRDNWENKTYNSFEELPEYVQAAISLLKMVENGKGIDEIGFKQDDHQFFVLREVE